MRKKLLLGEIVIALLICIIVFCSANNDEKEADTSQNKQAIKTETSLPETTVSSPVPTPQTDDYSNVFLRAFGKWEVIHTIGYGYIGTADSSEDYNGTEEILNKDDIVTAFINAMNKMTWEYIDNDNNTYDKIIKQESLQEPTNYKIYFSKENVSKKDKYYIDFIYQLKNNYSSLRISYSPESSCFSSEFVAGGTSSGSYEVVQEELNDIGAIFMDETVIKFPKPFVPDTQMTEKKEEMIKKIKIKIKELSKNIYGKDIYKAYIWDFSDADSRTTVLITNKDEKIMAEYPIEFYDEKGNEDIHIPLGVHVDIETSMDYCVGSMKYYKFFQLFSIKKFIVDV